MSRSSRYGWLVAALFMSFPSVLLGETTLQQRTVWHGEVVVSDGVKVAEGATLLILPGTRVRFQGVRARLLVIGTLVAQGTEAEPIRFVSYDPSERSGAWEGIRFEQSTDRVNRLSHVRIEGAQAALVGRDSLVIAENCLITGNHVGVLARSGFAGGISFCSISGNQIGARYEKNDELNLGNNEIRDNAEGITLSGSSPLIFGNRIINNTGHGILLSRGSNSLIKDNEINNNKNAIVINKGSNSPIINNDIKNNECGLSISKMSFPEISENVIADNGVGLYCNEGCYPIVNNNNIYGNEKYAVVLGENQSAVVARTFTDYGRAIDPVEQARGRVAERNLSESRFPIPEDGLVNARQNWWGTSAYPEGKGSGTVMNLPFIDDGHDQPEVTYQGKTYPRDRVAFAPELAAAAVSAGKRVVKLSRIRGRIHHNGEGVAGARIHLYPAGRATGAGEGVYYSAPADAQGDYSLFVKPGCYSAVAKATSSGFPQDEPVAGDLAGFPAGDVVVGEGETIMVDVAVNRLPM